MSRLLQVNATPEERRWLRELADDLAGSFPDDEDPRFLRQAAAFRLPDSLEETLHVTRGVPVLHLRSLLTIDSEKIGPTPQARDHHPSAARGISMAAIVVASRFGVPVATARRGGGRLVVQLLPVAGAELTQTGGSSEAALLVHTEDAHLQTRPDSVLLVGIRNHEHVSTTVVLATDVVCALEPETLRVLRQSRFVSRLDESYRAGGAEPGERRVAPVISVAPPQLRADTAEMAPVPDDSEAARAWRAFVEVAGAEQRQLIVGGGDILRLDNHAVMHGRAAFSTAALPSSMRRWILQIMTTGGTQATARSPRKPIALSDPNRYMANSLWSVLSGRSWS